MAFGSKRKQDGPPIASQEIAKGKKPKAKKPKKKAKDLVPPPSKAELKAMAQARKEYLEGLEREEAERGKGPKGRRVAAVNKLAYLDERSRADMLENPQVGAHILLGCYVVMVLLGFFGLWHTYTVFTTPTDTIGNGNNVVVGSFWLAGTIVWLATTITISRNFWGVLVDKEIASLRTYSIFTLCWAVPLMGYLAYAYGPRILDSVLAGLMLVGVFAVLFASILTYATNREIIDD